MGISAQVQYRKKKVKMQTFQEYQEQQAYDALTPAELQEASLSRVMKHTQERPIAIITAFRGDFARKENDARNRKLMTDIRGAGYGAIKVQGKYVEGFGTPEARDGDGMEISYVVVGNQGDSSGNLKGFAKKVGKKYDQDSVLYKDAGDDQLAILIGTNGTAWPGMNKEVELGKWHPNRVPEFYSKMRGGTFAFESVQFYSMKSPSQRRERLF